MAPLVNGRPTPFFKITHGLRQGYPLSPILYILMVEALRRRLDKERLQKTIPGIKITHGVKRINNSQFADDIILLGGASSIIAKIFQKAMDDYDNIWRPYNATKIQIYAWNTLSGILRRITNILDFPLFKNWQSFKYLGIPICLKSLPASSWNPILDKIKSKFHQWGSYWLNPAGRVILIKYFLSSLPIFHFPLF
jgi:hypothetical protein